MTNPERKDRLGRTQNFYEQPPFKDALDRAYAVLDPQAAGRVLGLGGVRRVLTSIARNPGGLHHTLSPKTSEKEVTDWLLTQENPPLSHLIGRLRLPTRVDELRPVLRKVVEELSQFPGWMGYIKTELKPNFYDTDGKPKTKAQDFTPARSFSYLDNSRKYADELLSGGLDKMITNWGEDN